MGVYDRIQSTVKGIHEPFRRFVNTLFLLLALFAASSAWAQTHAIILTEEERAWLSEHQQIIVGGEMDWGPFDFVDESDNYAGLANDYLKVISKRLGIEFKVVTGYSWYELLDLARQKKIDLLPAIYHSAERETYLHFTDSYARVTDFIFIRNETEGITAMDDLRGRTVSVVKGYTIESLLRDQYPDIRLITSPDVKGALRKIVTHDADAFIGDITSTSYNIRRYSIVGIKAISATPFYEPTVHMAARHDWPILRDILQKALDSITPEEHNTIKERWFFGYGRHKSPLRLTNEEKNWLDEHPVIRLGNSVDWPPIGFTNKNGVYSGIAADYMKTIEEMLGIRIQPSMLKSWKSTVDAARAGKVDILGSVVSTPQREEYLTFTTPYLSYPLGIITRENISYISDVKALENRPVGVNAGSATHDLLLNNYPGLNLRPMKNTKAGLMAVAGGETFAYISDMLTSSNVMANEGLTSLKISGELPFRYDISIGIRKEQPLLASIIQKALDAIPAERHNAIQRKWTSVTFEHDHDYTLLWEILASVAIILAVFFYWNRRLTSEVDQRKQAEKEQIFNNALLDRIHHAQSRYIKEGDVHLLFEELLYDILALTESE